MRYFDAPLIGDVIIPNHNGADYIAGDRLVVQKIEYGPNLMKHIIHLRLQLFVRVQNTRTKRVLLMSLTGMPYINR